jgi:hypothetical protein
VAIHRDRSPTFAITRGTEPSGTLLAGCSALGLAGLTAVDCVIERHYAGLAERLEAIRQEARPEGRMHV